ncbi:hypothetical protein A2526_01790 [candidate division WOR-1 bacterium RIFOXYD2_FULL_36_8]|uniref:Methyltransferase type 11 domain-containing protein n=1 Tax=candidate division WOR-1 bacterium RIFOXYB2_FULL_36_35 TaxID=1802578 RepID=A0A1F4S463_UNCSA|nr:MAG: hypothetical protein A2230_02970 [candidate division WOR-1 bacterium RIFOXYA2_FULL_36_21]OGC15133.1 MAG: hypothetical protein A2282_08970 [candidate division WOR-1 bacterium RIFOXYA12_FULL_36_13]OGC15167.1 MAG: hypothetical protein A2290_08880 [candidate division WOR-1 bacterium RIFOXYB2_FULL_36_35]OGC41838.1 MAG: hypothetical protein A2526_01790 [candidate division WOR-1 bacterium RIFOXYD2_FULL_36_8]
MGVSSLSVGDTLISNRYTQREIGVPVRSRIIKTGTSLPLKKLCEYGGQTTILGRVEIPYNIILNFVREKCLNNEDVRILDVGIAANIRDAKTRGVTTRDMAWRFIKKGYLTVSVHGLDANLDFLEEMVYSEIDMPPQYPPFNLPNLTYIEADATKTLGLSERSVDVVFCGNAVVYIYEQGGMGAIDNFLGNVRSVLKDGGLFLSNIAFTEIADGDYRRFIKRDNTQCIVDDSYYLDLLEFARKRNEARHLWDMYHLG